MIAVTFALPAESSDFVRRLPELVNKSIKIFHTGVGANATRARLPDFLRGEKFRLVISAGFAGAVRDDLRAGELFLAENFSDPRLLELARRTLANRAPQVARLCTSPRVIDSAAERSGLAQTSGAAAVDMETEIIAAECRACGIPLLSVRVISDTPTEPLPAAPDVLFNVERQQTELAKLFLYLLRNPAAVPRLVRFARRVGEARTRLADALIALFQSADL